MNKKANHSFTLEEAINLLISNKKINKGLTQSVIKQKWEEIMGSAIATHTTGIYLNGSTLYVYFNSSIIKNEMVYNKDKAIELINEALGYDAITELVIR